MRRLSLLLAVLPCVLFAAGACCGSVAAQTPPPSADSLAEWTPPQQPVTKFTDGADLLLLLGDSTWVALQESEPVTIGCDLGPEGAFWVFQPEPMIRRFITEADTSLDYSNLIAMEGCVEEVQYLWRKGAGVLPE